MYPILFQAINEAKANAEDARRNAQEAQEKYAEQASADAEAIRHKANETKATAQQLNGEAEQLERRLLHTQDKLKTLSGTVKSDKELTDEAKEKVTHTILPLYPVDRFDVRSHFYEQFP